MGSALTLDDFAQITNERIPTAAEMIAFAYGQGWSFTTYGGKTSLRVPNSADPVAVAFAKLLSREPYRTNVLAALNEPAPPPEPQPEPEGVVCGTCRGTFYCPDRGTFYCPEAEIRERVQSPHYCSTPGCPYR